jgi:tetrapyrrole methylase family protein / MazG family protein
MIDGFEFKQEYGFDDLVKIIAILRSPGGCPWDREQTHKSIRANFIEETYEVVEAIDNSDTELLREELGDVMLQVALHSQMECEKGTFTIGDVSDGVCKKLIVRHPHVFGDVKADTTGEVLKNWDEIKKRTKGQHSETEVLKTVPRVLPALMRSYKVQQKAARAGFDWVDVLGAVAKVHEELSELEAEINLGDKSACFDEFGDLLFSIVNIARFIGTEPEEALTASCDKFIKRFALCEKFAAESGRELHSMNAQELDALWCRAKEVLQSEAESPRQDFNKIPKIGGNKND